MSSAILYLAIVAIWAGVLVPRWLRRTVVRPAEAYRPAEAQHRDESAAPGEDPGVRSGSGVLSGSVELGGSVGRSGSGGLVGSAVLAGSVGLSGSGRAGESVHEQPETWASPADRRAGVLRARRRMLGTIIVLTAGAVGIAVTGLAEWWVVIPPGIMLGGFVLLLREAARSDAERAHRLAEQADAGSPARPAREQRAGAAPAVAEQARPEPLPEPEPLPDHTWTAQIIDISGRIGDQLYDQYADAAVRAVGD